MTKAEKAERAEAIERLRGIFPVGSTVYTILRHVSRSGMQRSISVMANSDGHIWDASGIVAKALGRTDGPQELGREDGWVRDGYGIPLGQQSGLRPVPQWRPLHGGRLPLQRP